MKTFESWAKERTISPNEDRQLRRLLNQKFGHMDGYQTPNQNGHTPQELLYWLHKAELENKEEEAQEWRMWLTKMGWL